MPLNFSQSQRISQKQIQKLGQVQIQALKYLSMNSIDLRKEIFNQVEKNPALEILDDSIESAELPIKSSSTELDEYTRLGFSSQDGEIKSQEFQERLENSPDNSQTLSEHLMFQFKLLKLPENQKKLGEKLINNLDKNGFHILAPVSFLNFDTDTQEDLEVCLDTIQKLEPCGCCCKNIEESLFVQAKNKSGATKLSLFILNGHLDFIEPPIPARALKKTRHFAKQESEKAFNTNDYSFVFDLTEKDFADAISFIQTLNPHPASEYSPSYNYFVIPDVRVEKIPYVKQNEELEDEIVSSSDDTKHSFVVHYEKGIIPEVTLSSEYQKLLKLKGISKQQKNDLEKMIHDGKTFLESLFYRENSVFNAAVSIVRAQINFFEKGPGYLIPLRQKDIAEILGVHETTVSRIANSKFLQCEWGLFPIKYFFVSGVSQENKSQDESETLHKEISKDKIMFEIKKILDAQPQDAKKLSDQKLSDMLAEKGIKVARRTIAKYRTQIGVKSSYER